MNSQDSSCSGQCHGCAFRVGAAANVEPHNHLRGIFAALGGKVFFCHDSLGWSPGLGGYPPGAKEALDLLACRSVLLRAGVKPEYIADKTAALRPSLRVCGGWKAAIASLKSQGWFTNPAIRFIRRHYATQGSLAIDQFCDGDPAERKAAGNLLRQTLKWFGRETKEAGVKVELLLPKKEMYGLPPRPDHEFPSRPHL